MTPQEKAKELLAKMTINADSLIYKNLYAKECALIAVDEVIGYGYKPEFPYKYWEEVKQEIKKL